MAFYSFITNRSYYYYFFIGIIISSVPIIPVIYLIAFLIIPELIILVILLLNGLEQGPNYYKMRVDKKAYILQHDPALTYYRSPFQLGKERSPVAIPLTFRMDEVWNPDSSIPLKSEDKNIEKKMFNLKIQLIVFLLTIVCLIFSIISAVIYF